MGFAWDDSEHGHFREDFFPPVNMPVVKHKPWVQRNIPISPGIYDEVCRLIKTKITTGVYEPSNSSYRSHCLEPLNAITIQHSGVPPNTDQIAEQFAARTCGGILDLYVRYDERGLTESSRDFTTFQTPFGAHRLVTLPMGWTNLLLIFHDDGPPTRYKLPNGSFETHPNNPSIRRFVQEHFQGLNRVVQRMKYSGGTFSGHKATLCVAEIMVVGHRCTYEGRLPDESRVESIMKWGPCRDLSDVRAFLGTIDFPFVFSPDQITAQDDLQSALLESPALRLIDYGSAANVILAVNTSQIAVGFHLCQCALNNPQVRYYAQFGCITLNNRKSQFSQLKLELYGLFCALRLLKMYLISVRNLIVKVDTCYIKGMLTNLDLEPSASINWWIVSILTFHFTLVHIPSTSHGPDGLSQ
ncbi:hypothetical protein HETIRDRAFT_456479 [Heterobasidion irregulare TC 32-1]|uniref:Reverse transcriptase RNase H-like domain-containing protein n=1 Tax=Heterobasidion irregulare (strain TC 32-1) TaxID=747525 RepID=W4JPJ2_HETIT|nr:uncharacterized protein HETIRDRAFT_456479 [Heterobasidion irregulare TC 32-1]ETW75010.1 hypothetical protein HETIRDRAFT_456479 [Heterobasidion irregulare TC 32-1]